MHFPRSSLLIAAWSASLWEDKVVLHGHLCAAPRAGAEGRLTKRRAAGAAGWVCVRRAHSGGRPASPCSRGRAFGCSGVWRALRAAPEGEAARSEASPAGCGFAAPADVGMGEPGLLPRWDIPIAARLPLLAALPGCWQRALGCSGFQPGELV